jgi:hypothetical protein
VNQRIPAVMLATALGAVGCSQDSAAPIAIQPAILRWMQCQECVRGELDSVVTIGAAAEPVLRHILVHGPPPDLEAQVDSQLRKPMHGAGGLGVPPAPLIEAMLEDYRSNYRVRASKALGVIGTDAARSALCDGKAQNFSRIDVRQAIDAALSILGGQCP